MFAWRAACESTGVAERKMSFWAARVGVADSFLMSYIRNGRLVCGTGQHLERTGSQGVGQGTGGFMCSSIPASLPGYQAVEDQGGPKSNERARRVAYLFQGLVVDKAGSIFGDLKLALLDLLAELPARRESCTVSGRLGTSRREEWLGTRRVRDRDVHVAAQSPGRLRVGSTDTMSADSWHRARGGESFRRARAGPRGGWSRRWLPLVELAVRMSRE